MGSLKKILCTDETQEGYSKPYGFRVHIYTINISDTTMYGYYPVDNNQNNLLGIYWGETRRNPMTILIFESRGLMESEGDNQAIS